MLAYLSDWLNLLLRWFHVVAAIAWIGESFYFVMLDRSLATPPEPARRLGVIGDFWSVHGGGFYHAEKYVVAPPRMPDPLHWSKWKAYGTWLSGAALLIVLYLLQPRTFLIDPAVADVTPALAITAASLFLLLGWIVYDLLCHLMGGAERRLGLAVGGFAVLAAFIATHLFSGRAAFLIVGAMLATLMSGNVFFVIIPGQRQMVDALARGETPDPRPGIAGRQRSVHNTYFTLPVVFAMISNHYAMTYSGGGSWIVLSLLMAAGALVRQFFVLWHSGTRAWALPGVGAALVLAAIVFLAPRPLLQNRAARAATAHPIGFAAVHAVIARRCLPCHSAHPVLMASAPEGVVFDTPAEIRRNAARIEMQAVQLRAMPLGNATGMTTEERQVIAAWIAGGAQ